MFISFYFCCVKFDFRASLCFPSRPGTFLTQLLLLHRAPPTYTCSLFNTDVSTHLIRPCRFSPPIFSPPWFSVLCFGFLWPRKPYLSLNRFIIITIIINLLFLEPMWKPSSISICFVFFFCLEEDTKFQVTETIFNTALKIVKKKKKRDRERKTPHVHWVHSKICQQ